MPDDLLTYYAQPSPMTDLEVYAARLSTLPRSIPELLRVLQGLMIHLYWADEYGIKVSEGRKQEVHIRSAAALLQRIWELDDNPLTVTRPPETRLLCTCRDFTVLLTAILRHQCIPARARCGFGTFFIRDHYEDHWQCEYWRADKSRWALADAQLDDLQRKTLQTDFDTADVPHDQFVTAGEGWQLCRTGQADPDAFGFGEWAGMVFISDNLLRDLAALNKMELLPWDAWGLMWDIDAQGNTYTPFQLALLDHVAGLTIAVDTAHADVLATYENDPDLRVPPTIINCFWGQRAEARQCEFFTRT